MITGVSIFIIASVLYDLFVGDRNFMRYALLTGAIIILLSSIVLHLVPLPEVKKSFRRQMGG